jgi:hypothetical protein
VFHAKFAYETLVHANRFLVPIDFPLSCVDPRAAIPALAMLHLARFQAFKVPSTFSQVLFETVNKVIPDRYAADTERVFTVALLMPRTSATSFTRSP